MESKTFVVPNISCDHCTNTVETELKELAGVQTVQAEVESKQVTVTWGEPASWAQIESLLHEINFPPQN